MFPPIELLWNPEIMTKRNCFRSMEGNGWTYSLLCDNGRARLARYQSVNHHFHLQVWFEHSFVRVLRLYNSCVSSGPMYPVLHHNMPFHGYIPDRLCSLWLRGFRSNDVCWFLPVAFFSFVPFAYRVHRDLHEFLSIVCGNSLLLRKVHYYWSVVPECKDLIYMFWLHNHHTGIIHRRWESRCNRPDLDRPDEPYCWVIRPELRIVWILNSSDDPVHGRETLIKLL